VLRAILRRLGYWSEEVGVNKINFWRVYNQGLVDTPQRFSEGGTDLREDEGFEVLGDVRENWREELANHRTN
jgi:hypothetical protein